MTKGRKGYTLYLAYGSNINRRQMARRCPAAYVAGTMELKNYRLLFKGAREGAHATVQPHKGGSVPVLAWWITSADEAALDRYEGYPFYYRKKYLKVKMDYRYRTAMMYVMNDEAIVGRPRPLGQPDPDYYATILEGYNEAGFDIETLRQGTVDSATE